MIPAQSQIRTVQCYPVGSPFAEPVIELGSGQQLFFSFDDLSSETNSYTYKIVHCDPDWNNSNLSSFTYLTGFFSNPLDNYEYSFNTVVPYTRFTLNLPNEEVGIKLSGNYLLQVYNDQNPDSAVVSQRFAVVENKVGIAASVVNSTNPTFLYTSRQLNFTVNYTGLQIYNTVRDTRNNKNSEVDKYLLRYFGTLEGTRTPDLLVRSHRENLKIYHFKSNLILFSPLFPPDYSIISMLY